MKIKKIAAFAAAAVMAAGIWTGIPAGTESVPAAVITAEAADTKLAAPKNVKAKAGDGKVTLTWDKVKGADAYRVYMYNDETEKYKKVKTVKNTKTTIKGLTNGETYEFKVAAAVKSGKSYKSGKLSKVVTATPKGGKSEDKPKEEKLRMKEIQLSADEMTGTWVYYDFLYLKPYTSGLNYDPNKIETPSDGFISSVCFLNEKYATRVYNDNQYGKYGITSEIKNNVIDPNSEFSAKFKTYSYGDDKYLFMQFINGDGENTYIFKYVPAIAKTKVTDTDKLEGRWTAVDFCDFNIKYSENYDPHYAHCDELYASGLIIKDGKMTLTSTDNYYWCEDESVGKDKIGKNEYRVYEINGTMYLYWQFINGDGGDQFYVFKKN